MIEAKNIYFSYDNKIIADNISLHLDKGELCTLAGINGCGKTTLMRIISGSVSPCKGNLYADGIEYNKYTKKELAKVISYLPQTRNIPSMTVEQLVSHGRFPHLGFSRIMTTKDKNEKEFTNFTPQQTAYLDVYKIHKELQYVTEKLAIMEMPCSVVDTLTTAINHIENARDILFKVMNGEGDPYTD